MTRWALTQLDGNPNTDRPRSDATVVLAEPRRPCWEPEIDSKPQAGCSARRCCRPICAGSSCATWDRRHRAVHGARGFSINQYDAKVDVNSLCCSGSSSRVRYLRQPRGGAVCSRNTRPSPDPPTLPATLLVVMQGCWAANGGRGSDRRSRADACRRRRAASGGRSLVPCGHVCCCADCAADLRGSRVARRSASALSCCTLERLITIHLMTYVLTLAAFQSGTSAGRLEDVIL